ncbi:MAG: hypothetical protein Q8R16_01590, partial [bacterium]|nr:hypothetical protein [bacterium]
VIPVIKDEGIGAARNKSNNDRVNFITLSWMNLTNVFVILAWYPEAEKKDEYRITGQKFDIAYVNKKIKEISEYQFDAHHWNNKHFIEDFVSIYKKAVSSYEKISKELEVKMHTSEGHNQFLEKIISSDKTKINLDKFAVETLGKSKLAAARETSTTHKREFLTENSEKPIFEMQNNLGGNYYLTSDEIFIDEKSKKVIIQESKNATDSRLPKEADIKDGLFKILLFSQIKDLKIDDVKYQYSVSLKLTGTISSSISLPAEKAVIENFVKKENFSNSEAKLVFMLDEEAVENKYKIIITNN